MFYLICLLCLSNLHCLILCMPQAPSLPFWEMRALFASLLPPPRWTLPELLSLGRPFLLSLLFLRFFIICVSDTPFSLLFVSLPAPAPKRATLEKEQNHHISKCRFSVQSALRRQHQPRTTLRGISQKMSPSQCLLRIVSPTFVSPRPVNTLPSRPGTRRSASTRSMSRVRVKERLFLSMRPPS